MALKKTLTDPLNWLLLLLAAAFVYYIVAVPYFTEYYLKTPQELTLEEYLSNPAHPRPFMMHALSAPPASMEVLITDLTVRHIDQDSILVEDPDFGGLPTAPEPETPAEGVEAGEGEADEQTPEGEVPAEEQPAAPEQDDQAEGEEPALAYVGESEPPNNQILLAGDNLDLLGVSEGQTISLRVHGLHQTPLGWVPEEVDVGRDQEEMFTKEELDALELLGIIVDGNETTVPYVEVGELRFASGTHAPGEPTPLGDLADDTNYVQTAQRLGGAPIDLHGVRLVQRRTEDRNPFFVVEDTEGHRARVFFNPRLLSEWYWAMDRLQGDAVLVRGTLRVVAPSDLRALEADANVQAILDGYDILSVEGDEAGATVINLENPSEGLSGPQDAPPGAPEGASE